MKRIILILSMIISVSTTVFALTPQEMTNQQAEASVNILVNQFQNARQTESNVRTQMINLQVILNLNGINWVGMDWNNPQTVNWTQY